ncbi:MAG: ATP-binding protein [Pseudomonadota bacterium]|nr:ATP-binding protein [Pseudomonadota bacterium]
MDGIEAVAEIDRTHAMILLAVLCDITGMRFAMVTRITGTTWAVCAVQDGLHLETRAGEPLPFRTNLALERQVSRTPIVIERASSDPSYSKREGSDVYQIESYVSVPILLSSGHYFGNLCALDPKPAKVRNPYVVPTFERFAALIVAQYEQRVLHVREHSALLDERAASELREQFIAVLGHDLRNPLQAVCAGADQLERKLTDPVLAGTAGRIKANARRMSSLIDDVLDFARGRLGGGIDVELTDVENINAGLMAVIRELQDAQPDSTILSNIGVDRPVRCDLGRIQQVASNLLANALTHTLPHSPIKICARSDGTDLVLEVWNAGEPIPRESLGKIFEPFWRHSVAASRHGLGLGLHICSQIVRAHDGQMSVTSTGEAGTQFTARLPLSGGSPRTVPAVVEAPRAAIQSR